MKPATAAIIQSGYYEGYNDGYKEGFAKAMESYQDLLLAAQNPRIIVTTEENLERIKKEYIK